MDTSVSESNILQAMQDAANFIDSKATAVRTDPREEVIIRYTHGAGRFSQDKKFISLKMFMFKMNGEPDGWHEGVWEANFSDPSEVLKQPSPPSGAMNKPEGPVPELNPLAYTKGIWAFGDDSVIYAVGPALSHLTLLDDNSNIFFVTTSQIITGGEGKYKGARGLKTSLGSTWNDRNIFTATGQVTFRAKTIDTFRIVRADDVA